MKRPPTTRRSWTNSQCIHSTHCVLHSTMRGASTHDVRVEGWCETERILLACMSRALARAYYSDQHTPPFLFLSVHLLTLWQHTDRSAGNIQNFTRGGHLGLRQALSVPTALSRTAGPPVWPPPLITLLPPCLSIPGLPQHLDITSPRTPWMLSPQAKARLLVIIRKVLA